jgi:hypothetical protein
LEFRVFLKGNSTLKIYFPSTPLMDRHGKVTTSGWSENP